MPNKKRSGIARKGAVKLPCASLPSCFAAVTTRDSAHTNISCDKDLNEAIAASKASALQKDAYDVALVRALQESRATAEAEAEEEKQLRLAMEESMAIEEQKSLSLGLKRNDQLIVHAKQATAELCGGHMSSRMVETNYQNQSSTALPALQQCESKIGHSLGDREHGMPSYVLKITCGHDTRRLRAEWSPSSPFSEVLSTIWAAAEEGFEREHGSFRAFTLRYRDDEGDLCTLVEGTVQDFLEIARTGKSLKLVLEEPCSIDSCEVYTDMPQLEAVEALGEFCIATPPTTPRDKIEHLDESIEDDYDSAWSLVDVAVQSSTSS